MGDPLASGEDRLEAAKRLALESAEVIAEVIGPTPQPTALDVLLALRQRIAAAHGVGSRSDMIYRRPQMTIGNLVKILPAEDANAITELLTFGDEP